MNIPALDSRKNRPTTLSGPVIKDLLQEKMGFEGLVMTDAMEMQGVLKHFPSGIAEAEALLAGNDMILLPVDLEKAVSTIKKYISNGKIDMAAIEKSVKKILGQKYHLGIHRKAEVLIPSMVDSLLNRPEAMALKHRLIKEALTLVEDQNNLLPIRNISSLKVATVGIGYNGISPFQKRISDYYPAKHFAIKKEISIEQRKKVLKGLEGLDQVIVGIHDMSKYKSKDFGITETTRGFLEELKAQNPNTTIVLFGSPYALKYFQDFPSLVVAYEDDDSFQDLAAQSLFGATSFRGKLPVSVGRFAYGTGIQKENIGRLGYGIPENVGLSSQGLAAIDTIVAELIEKKAAPGCQVLVAKDGQIVFDKSYGHFTYQNKHKVGKQDIYDVASVTKVLATTISLMKLVDQGFLDVKDPVAKYIPQLDTTNKKEMLFDEMLAHHAKLIGWIPFYLHTVSDNRRNPKPLPTYYSKRNEGGFSIPVARNLYMRKDYRDSIWSLIYGSKMREQEGYRYSDLAFYLAHNTVKNITGKGVDVYAYENFYFPMGLSRTGFNPHMRFPIKTIAPTEEDVYFRRQRLQGYVHDMGAAMLGGVSGHAGLFSNTTELAALMQMLLNGGSYGGEKYLSKEVIELFTKRYSKSTRRGLGFDMKELDTKRTLNMSELASDETFGHLGFTGTSVFADPKHNIVYIFLSNRTYPRMQNNKLGRYEYRPRIQSVIYNSLLKENLP
jgi:CubicO group peptidase (beta-lactamase class C family)